VTVALFTLHAGVDWIWESTAVAALAVVAATAAAAATSDHARRWSAAPRLIAAAAAVALIGVMVPGIASEHLVRHSRAAAGDGDLPRSLRSAEEATRAEPWAATPFVQRALILERLGRLAEARAAMRAAIAREPTNWRHPYIAARIDAEMGLAGRALADLRRARRLRPLGRFVQPPAAATAPRSQ
jgi:tetratricopeptide (TPR) repeat protein